MMNSMSKPVDFMTEQVQSRFNVLNVDKVNEHQVSYDVANIDVPAVLSYLKAEGWIQLSMLTCVDWIDDNQFELVYIIFNWDNPIYIQVRTRIDRDNAVFGSMMSIYPGIKYYERDVHEFFGVEFEGNPDSNKQLFLEGWDDMPPLRKDFDPKAYSDRKYLKREYPQNYNTKKGSGK